MMLLFAVFGCLALAPEDENEVAWRLKSLSLLEAFMLLLYSS